MGISWLKSNLILLIRILTLTPPFFINPYIIILIFILFLFFFNILFSKLIPLNSIGIKKIDYYWFGFAFISLLFTISKLNTQWYNIPINDEKNKIKFYYSEVINQKKNFAEPMFCTIFEKSKNSPPNFDEIQHEYNEACHYVTNYHLKNDSDDIELQYKSISGYLNLIEQIKPKFTAKSLLSDFELIEKNLNNFNLSYNNIKQFEKKQKKSNFIETIEYYSPLLLSIALALRFTKTRLEINLEKYKQTVT